MDNKPKIKVNIFLRHIPHEMEQLNDENYGLIDSEHLLSIKMTAFLYYQDMIADEKAARQKNHEKRTVFHVFLLFMRQKRVFMKSEVKIIF